MYTTESPFSGTYDEFFEDGIYVCKKCNKPLFLSISKFNSGCGWPAFDYAIEDSTEKILESDGRTETQCKNCHTHLGHVFFGEKYTPSNTRYCINSKDLIFIGSGNEAAFASGCYWGTQYWFDKKFGSSISTRVGYMGGNVKNPSYQEVCTGKTEHLECIYIKFDNKRIYYSDLVKLFFETHDPEQTNGQGIDIGSQYLSAIFYFNLAQKVIAEHFIKILEKKGMKIATKLLEKSDFFPEKEDYHDKYYEKIKKSPTCHFYRKIF